MLGAADNNLLTRTGPGAPMGAMLREYWWPVLRSDRLERDGEPVRVRLMGEDYVAFRATDGRVGVFDERCPHRGVSLMLARNEDCALRCILHGWKIGVEGKVLETPNEKEGGERLARLKVRSLAVREAAGMVWVWAGAGEPPAFPNYAFNSAVSAHPMMGIYRCNWFQLMETLWDAAHVYILHAQGRTFAQQFSGLTDVGMSQPIEEVFAAGFESRDTPLGFHFRFTEGFRGKTPHWSATVMPSWVFVTAFADNPNGDRVALGHVPIDDENMMLVQITYNMERELGELGRRSRMGVDDFHNFVPHGQTRENNWNQDRAAMKEDSFTGIGMGMYVAGILLQDQAALESMGPIADRSIEQVGPADHGIIKGRRFYLDAVRSHIAGKSALGIGEDFSAVGREGGSEYACAEELAGASSAVTG